jgi:hypothetical protein
MKFSTADLTILRIRCQKCGQHLEKLVVLLVGKDALPCSNCGGRISLATPTNKFLISETAASCARVGEALMKASKLLAVAAFGVSVAYAVPVRAQTLKKEPDPKQISCGEKVLVENNTCPAGQILEVTGSCLDAKLPIDKMPRGIQYHCINLK